MKSTDSSVVFIGQSQVPLHCPLEGAPLWALHPRVFLPLDAENQTVTCPYCSTVYQFKS